MGRRKQGGFELIASMPWPVGIALGIVGYLAIRYGIGWYLSSTGGSIGQAMGKQAAGGIFAPLAWMALVICWAAAGWSFLRSRRRKKLLETQTGLDSLAALSWREFEMLVGEALRRQGYAVEETGLGGADGGIDLIARKAGRTELVQCKQWRTRQVTAATVREMWGLVSHHRADGVKIFGIGEFTRDASAFAQGKSIELINGAELLAQIRSVQTSPEPPKATVSDGLKPVLAEPVCPSCGELMTRRSNRQSGKPFWGCSTYPKCKATLPIM